MTEEEDRPEPGLFISAPDNDLSRAVVFLSPNATDEELQATCEILNARRHERLELLARGEPPFPNHPYEEFVKRSRAYTARRKPLEEQGSGEANAKPEKRTEPTSWASA